MGAEDYKHGAISVLLVFSLVLSMVLVAPLASPGDWVNRPAPGDTTIDVDAGEDFLIRYMLEWDEPENGAYTITVGWYNYGNKPEENLTFVSAEAYFTTGDNVGESIRADATLSSAPSGTDTAWVLEVSCPAVDKDPRDGEFNVDIWMGAYGVGGVPHIPGDHVIPWMLGGVIVTEAYPQSWIRNPITIRVLPKLMPTLKSPADGTITNDNTPTFEWTVSSNADNHRLLVDNDPDFASPIENRLFGSTDNTYTPALDDSLPDDNYSWKVIAISALGEGQSSTWTFLIDTIAPMTPTLVSPENDAVGSALTQTFTWTEPEAGVTYNIQIDNETSFTLPHEHENTGLTDNSYTYTFASSGVYYWRVRAVDAATNQSSWSDKFKLTIQAPPGQPTPNLPTDGAITNDNIPTFEWTVGANADNHRLLVDNDPDFTSPIENRLFGSTDNTYTPAPENSLPDDNYSWKVIAINVLGENQSSTWTFLIDTIAPMTPTLVSPENDAVGSALTQTFTWTEPEAGVTYDIQIDNETSFTSPYVHENTGLVDNSYIYTFASDGVYYWRVRAVDAANNQSSWADNFKLAIQVPPGQPTIYLPTDGAITNDNTPTFEWTVGANADNHRLLVDNDSDFTSPIENRLFGSTDNTYTPALENSLPDDNYSWKVIAINAFGENESSTRTFLIDTIAPATPTLGSPENNAVESALTQTFTWTEPEAGVTYDIQIDSEATFTPPYVHENTGLTDNSYTYTFASDGVYYWRVRAVDAANNQSSWADNSKLTIQAPPVIVRTVEVSILPPENSGVPEGTLTYTVTVRNTGNVGDNYNLAASDNAGWMPWLDNNLLTIPAGENRKTTLRVIVDERASSGEEDRITVTATSTTVPTVSDNATCIARVVIVRTVEVSISPPENSEVPGEKVSFTVTVINTGNVEDSYNLEASDNAVPSWAPTVSPTLLGILAGDNRTATVSVIIPDGTTSGMEDEIAVKATSSRDNRVSDNATCIATAITSRRVGVSISPENKSGAPGETITFTVTVKNTGSVSDNYDLTADDNANWSLTLPGTLTDVVPGESRTVNLSVGIPDDAENSTRDNVTVIVTSRTDNTVKNSASCTAHAVVPPPEHGVQVSISPEDQRGSPKETLTYTVTVKNTGNAHDNYDLTVSDYEGWGAILAQNLLTIPAGESRTTTASVTVPSDAAEDELTHINVIATSRADPTVSDSITSRAIAEGAPEGIEVEFVLLVTSAFLIGAAILVPAYLLRGRPKKAARRRVLRDVSFGFR